MGRFTCKRLFDTQVSKRVKISYKKKYIYESMDYSKYSLEDTRCIYSTFWALDLYDKSGNVILTHISEITT